MAENNNIPGNLPSPAPVLPSMSVPKPATPVFSIPPKLVLPSTPTPISTSTPATLPVKPAPIPMQEIKAVIRTMESDLKTASQGGIKGQEVKISSPTPGTPPPAPILLPVLPKPPVANLNVLLGSADKRTAPLPSSGPVKPALPPAPVVPPKIVITAPSVSSGPHRSFLPILLIILVVIVVGGGAYYWWSTHSGNTEVAYSPTPTPELTETPTPAPSNSLETVFANSGQFGVRPSSSLGLWDALYAEVNKISLATTTKNILIEPSLLEASQADEQMVKLNFVDFGRFFITGGVFGDLVQIVSPTDFGLIIGTQHEYFNAKGKPDLTASTENRFTLAVAVSDATGTITAMSNWESTMPTNFAQLFRLPAQKVVKFLDNTHRTVAVRYANFPTPDRTIDYAVVHATDGKDYLLISNSREQIYSTIDAMLGF